MKFTDTIPASILLSSVYDFDSDCIILKFYEPISKELLFWKDDTNYRPYCYSRLTPQELDYLRLSYDIKSMESIQRKDLLNDEMVSLTKITTNSVGGYRGMLSLKNAIEGLESNIRFQDSYLYDNDLIIGKWYKTIHGKLTLHDVPMSEEMEQSIQSMLWDKLDYSTMIEPDKYKDSMAEWINLFNQPIPDIKRMAIDIEVEIDGNKLPDTTRTNQKIIAVSFKSKEINKVFVLRNNSMELGTNKIKRPISVVFYPDEKQMIMDTFKLMERFPIILTFNGDLFDLPYLKNRGTKLGISDNENPIKILHDGNGILKDGINIDLYRVFSNRSYQIYTFSNKYKSYSLDVISKAMLGKGKIEHKGFNTMTMYEMAEYCFNDSLLTYELTTFDNNILMNVLIITSKISKMSIDAVSRYRVSQWMKSSLYYEHRKNNCLIPSREFLDARSTGVDSNAVTEGKKYRGANVLQPKSGIHYGVSVLDFASLYPSIIKTKNLSYETVRCIHDSCKNNPDNSIPQTTHWKCSKRDGITSNIIGIIRDLRVNYYKHLAKSEMFTPTEKAGFDMVAASLKVIINASYGIIGSDIFPIYYLPVADATTAYGRDIIEKTVKSCEGMGIEVLYGDTDSVFIKKPEPEKLERIINEAKNDSGVDLEVDTEFRYCALSDRKKNYFGVTNDGYVVIKGLTGKKSHTPQFIKNIFSEILDELKTVHNEIEMEQVRSIISNKIKICADLIQSKNIPLKDLAFTVSLTKELNEYVKTKPQHVKAALQLTRKVGMGEKISYIKVGGMIGVKPIEMAKNTEINSRKYLEFLETTMDQIISPLGMTWDGILGKPVQSDMSQFFG